MPATDAIDAAALGKHSYMHCKILTEILNICCLLSSFFLLQFSIASYCMHMLQVKIKLRLKVINLG